ncbi:hypothetical protein ABI59_10485 [Acidobacteria bacterium Mor1]|nr:hypothetical protein ABI59_10485 [Acidobacteria bacterium Mor1]
MSVSRITSLGATQRDSNRVSVKIDGKFVTAISARSLRELRLEVGMEVDAALLKALDEAATYDKALQKAMDRLSRRAHSRRELDLKLRRLEYETAVRERVLDRLTELGLIDDRAFAEAVVRDTAARKPAGPRLLKQKLMQKGVDGQTVDDVLADLAPAADEQAEQALELVRKKLPSMARLDAVTRKRRLYGMLGRRGFDYEAIESALRLGLEED